MGIIGDWRTNEEDTVELLSPVCNVGLQISYFII